MFANYAASDEAPDVFTLEWNFVKHYVNSNATGSLSDVGLTDSEMSVSFPSSALVGQDLGGVQKGLSWQSTPGVLFYRASLAQKYLGVKTPEEMQQKVNSWEAFLQTAEELKVNSEGACKMVTGTADVWQAYKYYRSQGWVADDTLNIDGTLLGYEELCKTLEQDDLTQKAGAWGETWFAGMRGEIETLCYFLPTWGLHYTLKPNCVAGWDAENPDSEENVNNAIENGTYGDWRMTVGPTSYVWGGTYLATNAAKVAAADDAKKAAIRDLIYFFTLDENFQTQYAADTGDFVNSMAVVENILANGGTPNPFLGGQDHTAMFAQAAALADGSLKTEFDDDIDDLWDKYVTIPYSKGEKDLETCLNEFRNQVSAKYPSFSISDIPKKLAFSISLDGYQETFTSDVTNRYFVLPSGAEAQLSMYGISFGESDEAAYEITGDSIQITDSVISAVKTGLSIVSAWVVSDGEAVADSVITANVLVIDPQKTVTIPDSVTWLESEAFRGINAECLIIPGDIWAIESNCFANCPNLNTVIWTGDPSGARVMAPFSSTNSILFLSGNGLMPRGLNATKLGVTSFSGF